jgi:hypothetical protein
MYFYGFMVSLDTPSLLDIFSRSLPTIILPEHHLLANAPTTHRLASRLDCIRLALEVVR